MCSSGIHTHLEPHQCHIVVHSTEMLLQWPIECVDGGLVDNFMCSECGP